jgi:hypothetical protein
MKRQRQPTPDELRYHCAQSLEKWRDELARRLSPDDSWRLLLASTINALLAVGSDTDAARVLREAADLIEAGKPPIN